MTTTVNRLLFWAQGIRIGVPFSGVGRLWTSNCNLNCGTFNVDPKQSSQSWKIFKEIGSGNRSPWFWLDNSGTNRVIEPHLLWKPQIPSNYLTSLNHLSIRNVKRKNLNPNLRWACRQHVIRCSILFVNKSIQSCLQTTATHCIHNFHNFSMIAGPFWKSTNYSARAKMRRRKNGCERHKRDEEMTSIKSR